MFFFNVDGDLRSCCESFDPKGTGKEIWEDLKANGRLKLGPSKDVLLSSDPLLSCFAHRHLNFNIFPQFILAEHFTTGRQSNHCLTLRWWFHFNVSVCSAFALCLSRNPLDHVFFWWRNFFHCPLYYLKTARPCFKETLFIIMKHLKHCRNYYYYYYYY